MAREALLIIDMLNDFVLKNSPLEVPDAGKIVPAIKREIGSARENKIPVIYVCDSHAPYDREFSRFGWPPHAVIGTEGAKVIDALSPLQGDIIIEKTTYSGFYETRLDGALKRLNIDGLRLTGCITHICVMFTASDAVLRGYRVSIVKDCVAGLAEEDHDAALRIMKNVMGVEII